MSEATDEFAPVDKSLSLLMHSARVSPILRDAVAVVEAEVERLRRLTEGDPTSIYHEAAGLRAENERLRVALRVVASNMLALEDGGCDFPRVTDSFTVATEALR
jgi:hypothetical protein